MSNWPGKLRIGEKIGFGFGIVGLLFLGVVWQYHATLDRALNDYQRLYDVYGVRKAEALEIEGNMLRAQHAEKGFLLSREERLASLVHNGLMRAEAAATRMKVVEDEPVAERLRALIGGYRERFEAVAEAWRLKGLDHDSGLQGAFRDSVHQLEAMAGQFNVDRLYLLLLQIRRSEKDLGLRREPQYRDRVLRLVQDFSAALSETKLVAAVKGRLSHEIMIYRSTFEQYAAAVLDDLQPHPGKGPFRQAAHRVEGLLKAHHLSGLGELILQVRRREKDYLLRDDKLYVDMTIAAVDEVAGRVRVSAIAEQDKMRFSELIENYRRDFLALVRQNDHIERLHDEMAEVVEQVTDLVEANVHNADQAMNSTRQSTDDLTTRSERALLWVVGIATLLGIALAILITTSIARPLRAMAGLLDRLAAEQPTERMPYLPGGRDEVNLMAGSVNAIADHKIGFMDWWKAAMSEADACERLQELLKQTSSTEARWQAEKELRHSIRARHQLLLEQHESMHQLLGRIIDRVDIMRKGVHSGANEVALNTVRYLARSMQTKLEMLSWPDSGSARPTS